MHVGTAGTDPDSLFAMEAMIATPAASVACLYISVGLINQQAVQKIQPTFEAKLLLLVHSIQKVFGLNLGPNTSYPKLWVFFVIISPLENQSQKHEDLSTSL